MVRYHLGCTGWGYDAWRGGFYPPGTPPGQYLERYARVYDHVEVDSSYYEAPDAARTQRWADATPDAFTFHLKLPGAITHRARLRDVDVALDSFLNALAPLRAAGKLGHLVAQFPASFRHDRDADALLAFLDNWPRDHALAIELRHRSWFEQDTLERLRSAGAVLVWSDSEAGRTPATRTHSDIIYARLIGDRTLTHFDRVQRTATEAIGHWAAHFRAAAATATDIYVLLNNHFMGFAPASTAAIAQALDLPVPSLARARRQVGQASLDELFEV